MRASSPRTSRTLSIHLLRLAKELASESFEDYLWYRRRWLLRWNPWYKKEWENENAPGQLCPKAACEDSYFRRWRSWIRSRLRLSADLTHQYLLVAREVIENESIYDGGLSDGLVPKQNDLALHSRVVLHISNYILSSHDQNPKQHLLHSTSLKIVKSPSIQWSISDEKSRKGHCIEAGLLWTFSSCLGLA